MSTNANVQFSVSPINVTEEVKNYFTIKKQYFEHLRNIVEKKGKKSLEQSIKPIYTRISDLSSDEYETYTINTPLIFKEDSDENNDIFILESYDNEKLVLKKSIFVKKTLDPLDEVKKINREIHESNIVYRLKDLMDNINYSNKIADRDEIIDVNGNIISNETALEKLSIYESDFNNLKEIYNELYQKKNDLDKIQRNILEKEEEQFNTINQKEINMMIEYSKLFFGLFNSNGTINKMNFKNYIICQKKLDSLFGLNSILDKGRIVNVQTEEDNTIIAIVQENISESEVLVTPIFSSEKMKVNIDNQVDTKFPKLKINTEILGLRQQYKLLENNFINIIEKEVDTRVELEVYFDGFKYEGDIDYFPKKIQPEILNPIKPKSKINIIGIRESEFYNKTGSVFIIGIDAQSYQPGSYLKEILTSDDQISDKYSDLKLHKSWRKKLSYEYVDSKFETIGRVVQPITIDNKLFASVIHFYYFSKFDISKEKTLSRKKRQYEIHAKKFRFSLSNLNGYLSGNDLKRHGHMLDTSKRWVDVSRDILKKGLYAKFLQNNDLMKTLLSTKDSILVSHVKGNDYEVLDELMEIRHMLKNKITPDTFYKSFSEDLAFSNNNKIKINKAVEEKKLSLVKISKKKKKFNDTVAQVSEEISSSDDKSPETKVKQRTLYNRKKVDEVYNKQLKLVIQYFGEEIVKQMSQYDREMAAIKLTKFFDSSEQSFDAENLEDIASILEQNKLQIFEVPPDGDCMYYSVVHGLHSQNIIPMDFSKSIKYSSKKTIKNVSMEEQINREVFTDAVREAREEIATKMHVNFSNKDKSEELVNIEIIIGNEHNINKHLEGVRLMASSEQKSKQKGLLGAWGGIWELIAASALYNVNFILHSTRGYSKNITAEKSRTIFKHGKVYNSEIAPKTISLGYIEGVHYVLGLAEESLQGGTRNSDYRELPAYVVNMKGSDGNMYSVVSLKIENNYEIIGILNRQRNKIEYKIGNSKESLKLMSELGDKMKRYWKYFIKTNGDLNNIEKILYWQDRLNNKLYDSNTNHIGMVINKEDEHTGDSYIELKFH